MIRLFLHFVCFHSLNKNVLSVGYVSSTMLSFHDHNQNILNGLFCLDQTQNSPWMHLQSTEASVVTLLCLSFKNLLRKFTPKKHSVLFAAQWYFGVNPKI